MGPMEKVCERGAQYGKDRDAAGRVGMGLGAQHRAGGDGRDDAGCVRGGGLGSRTAAASGSAETCGAVRTGIGCAHDEPPAEPGVARRAARTTPAGARTNGTGWGLWRASRATGVWPATCVQQSAAAGLRRHAAARVRPATKASVWRTRDGGSAGSPGRLAKPT